MQQSLSLPLTAPTFFLRLISLPSAALERYWTLPKLSRSCGVAVVLDQAVELVADLLDVLLGDDLRIDEADDRDPVNVLEAEVTARGLRHRTGSCTDHATGAMGC